MEKVNDFTNHLRSVGLAESTVRAYTYAAGLYEGNRGKSLTELRTWLGAFPLRSVKPVNSLNSLKYVAVELLKAVPIFVTDFTSYIVI